MTWRLQLPWLCKPPHDFRLQLKSLDASDDIASSLKKMASYALNIDQLHSLSQACTKYLSPTLSLGIISNGTVKLLSPCFVATGLRYDLFIKVVEGSFDQVLQDAVDINSAIHQQKPDVVLVALDHRGIPGLRDDFEADEQAAIEKSIDFIKVIRDGLLSQKATRLIFQTVPTPPEALFGSSDLKIVGSRNRRIEAFNRELSRTTSEWGDILVDVASLAASIGLDRWFDEPKWHVGKLSVSPEVISLYADHCLRLLAITLGKKIRKCLVLDLDNTLWGGVIGDDGLSGIVLGQGSAQGEAYLAVQKVALALQRRGIILCVCSKNDDEVARLPFKQHPDMILKESHITIFLANWRDKATNLAAIASTLNISTDALVFLDDNPAERQQVRDVLPDVGVPELPDDPALFGRTLLAGGYFETLAFNQNDMLRTEQYQANAQRAVELAKYRDLNSYLKSLNMTISFNSFDLIGRARIVQLINRSNQFNLTTRRYSEAEIISLEESPEFFTVQVRLMDNFGDNGMISVVICRKQTQIWEIETWLMSCRVLNRRVEEAVLDYLVSHAKECGASRLIGFYYPTERNSLVKDHYKKLGFSFNNSIEYGEAWELKLDDYQPKNPPIQLQIPN